MPGKEIRKPINLCARQNELLNYTVYEELFNNYNLHSEHKVEGNVSLDDYYTKQVYVDMFFTVKERFRLILDASEVFQHFEGNEFVDQYILSSYICYQVYYEPEAEQPHLDPRIVEFEGDIANYKQKYFAQYNLREYLGNPYSFDDGSNENDVDDYLTTSSDTEYTINPLYNENEEVGNVTQVFHVIDNITEVRISVSKKGHLPTFEYFIAAPVSINNKTKISISSNYYRFNRQPYPYVDNCVNYTTLGFRNKDDAVNSCLNSMQIAANGWAARTYVFRSGIDYPMNPSTVFLDNWQCQKMFESNDCEEEITFTNIVEEKLMWYDIEGLEIRQYLSTEPSYEISNQVKIENVDYVTYIFGAAGTWFGFCFLMLNPVALIDLLDKKDSVDSDPVSAENTHTQPEVKMQKKIREYGIEIAALKHNFNQMTELIRNIQDGKFASPQHES